MNSSAVYLGDVVHRRCQPRTHRLRYRVFSLLLRLDELEQLDARHRLFAYNRAGLLSFHDSDHGPGDGSRLQPWIQRQLRAAGLADIDGPVYLLCYPRMLGYVFNPLSVYYCHDKDDRLRAIVYEVGNTHGERHCYVLPADAERGTVRQTCRKEFYVSPFLPMDCQYRFHTRIPGQRLSLLIRETIDDRKVLDAWFCGARRELTDGTLLKLVLRFPLMTVKIISGIHWEALRLWLKGLPVYRHHAHSGATEPRVPSNLEERTEKA